MPNPREILNFVRRVRGQMVRDQINILGPDYTSILGRCESVGEVTDQFGGNEWRSNIAVSTPGQKYPGHTIAVIPTRNSAGIIVDFTDTQKTFLGSVPDMQNDSVVQKALEKVTGFGGWKKRPRLNKPWK